MSDRRHISFVGIKRSGNHAAQNWILHQIPEPISVINNYQTDAHKRISESTDFDAPSLYTGPRENESAMYTYENLSLQGTGYGTPMHISDFKKLPPYNYLANILLLRDPFNNLASLYQHALYRTKIEPPHVKNFALLWRSYAHEFINNTRFLTPLDSTLKPGKVCLSYNEWFKSEPYRRTISQQLGLSFNDNGLQFVNAFGNGSSFDGQQLQGSAQAMNVLNRWSTLEDFRKPEPPRPPGRGRYPPQVLWADALKILVKDKDLMKCVQIIFPEIFAEVTKQQRLWELKDGK
jgi:hypothetical protein|tara:strand:- start:1197 stop:2069 length:873 start_codon:yes stop_codon:yes gene_type:complete